MTDKEILKQTILKVKNKLDWKKFENQHSIFFKTFDMGSFEDNWAEALNSSNQWKMLIFSHEFCKAFWGENNHKYTECNDENCRNCSGCGWITNTLYCWQYYLQQMVLEKEPLKYLEKFL